MKDKQLIQVLRSAHSALSLSHVRLYCLQLTIICICLLVWVRAADLMVVRGNDFREAADANRFFTKTLLPNRGIILDRWGHRLVQNNPVYKMAKSDQMVAHPQLVPIDSTAAFNLLLHHPQRLYQESSRTLLYPEVLSHVVGYTGFATGNDLANVATLNQAIGKTGMEHEFDATLRGTAGSQTYEMSAQGQLLRLAGEQPAVAGTDLTLSVDASLSAVAYQALAGRPGTAIVTDVPSGQILTMVSSPSFTPETLSSVLNDPNTPLINRSLYPYPPGSVFKMIVALAGLESQTIDTHTLLRDEGVIKVGAATFNNWYYSQYGRIEGDINVVTALAHSNDIFFYKLAGQVGPDAIAAMARKFHLGETTGLELSDEGSGLIPTPAWKDKQKGEKWYLGDTYHMGIGQGDVLVTPVQLNTMTAALARGGTWCTPTLLFNKAPGCEDLNLQPTNLQLVQTGMVEACSRGGTGFPFFAWNETASDSAKVACKTGTAEHGGANDKGQRKTDAWFTMYYPITNPRITITVMLESTSDQQFLEGSADAAPIAKTIWEAWRSQTGQ